MNTFIRQKAEQTDRQTDKQTNKQKQTSDIHSCDEDSFTCSNWRSETSISRSYILRVSLAIKIDELTDNKSDWHVELSTQIE